MDALLDTESGTDEGFAFGGSVSDSSILNSSFSTLPGAFISLSNDWEDLTNVLFTSVVQGIAGNDAGGRPLPVIEIVGVSAIAFVQY